MAMTAAAPCCVAQWALHFHFGGHWVRGHCGALLCLLPSPMGLQSFLLPPCSVWLAIGLSLLVFPVLAFVVEAVSLRVGATVLP